MARRATRLYTIGYQGKSLAAYIEALVAVGVGVVVDVREVPWSYKPGFSKAQLERALATADIGYVHVKAAGNPATNRKTAKSVTECLTRYRVHLANNPDCLEVLLLHVRAAARTGKPACLTCFEHLPADCHRSILAEELGRLAPELSTTHLPA